MIFHGPANNDFKQWKLYATRLLRVRRNCLLIFGLFFSALAHAEPQERYGADMFGAYKFYLRPEYFVWKEYMDSAAPALLTETGARIRVGLFTSSAQWMRAGSPLNWNFDLSGYMGVVDYNGQLFDGTPFQTSTNYKGITANLGTGTRLWDNSKFSSTLVVGALLDFWTRELVANAGYVEEYVVATLRGGIKIVPTIKMRPAIEFGVRYPMYTQESVAKFNIVLTPTPLMGFYGKLDLTNIVRFKQRTVSAALTYDLIRFDASPKVYSNVYPQPLFQPISTMRLVGLQIGF
ncbi:MAG: hypothetical protein OEW08_11335 [Gammaproteobacteria bacterium]|nr:hypothetical protein [Gammaproteobacteria bacterium]